METIKYKFVTSIPDNLEDGILYVTMEYGTAIHKCICGCGNEVVTPFSPTDWSICYDGEFVTLDPSIGNWNFECQSHYWIIRSEIVHSSKWNEEEIEYRNQDKKIKAEFYKKQILENDNREKELVLNTGSGKLISWWEKLTKFIWGIF